MLERVIGVLFLQSQTFEQIEHDENATVEAAIIVIVTAILSGIGTGFGSGRFVGGFLTTLIGAVLGWVVWAYTTQYIGTKFFDGDADVGEMLRVLGYAKVPTALNVLSFLPIIGGVATLIASLWMLLSAFTAAKQGLDLDARSTLITIGVGWAFVVAISIVTSLIFGVPLFVRR